MIILVVVLAVLLLAALVLVVVLLDAALLGLAERRAAAALAEPLGRPVTVRLAGRPFLTQARRGIYADVALVGGGLRIGEITGATLDARLYNVHLPLRELRGRGTGELSCERVTGQIVLPFGEIARVARIPGLELQLLGERLLASAALPVPGFAQLARVSGEARLSLADGHTVWLRIRGVSVAGFSIPGIVLNQLLPTLNVPITLPVLPYGLRLDELRPTPDGLVVSGSAAAVTFRRLSRQDVRPVP